MYLIVFEGQAQKTVSGIKLTTSYVPILPHAVLLTWRLLSAIEIQVTGLDRSLVWPRITLLMFLFLGRVKLAPKKGDKKMLSCVVRSCLQVINNKCWMEAYPSPAWVLQAENSCVSGSPVRAINVRLLCKRSTLPRFSCYVKALFDSQVLDATAQSPVLGAKALYWI